MAVAPAVADDRVGADDEGTRIASSYGTSFRTHRCSPHSRPLSDVRITSVVEPSGVGERVDQAGDRPIDRLQRPVLVPSELFQLLGPIGPSGSNPRTCAGLSAMSGSLNDGGRHGRRRSNAPTSAWAGIAGACGAAGAKTANTGPSLVRMNPSARSARTSVE